MSVTKDKQTDIAGVQKEQEQLSQQAQDMTPTSDSEGAQDMDKGKDIQEELEQLRKRVAELEPAQKTEQELALEKKSKELWKKEINLTLRENELEDFAEFISATDSEQLNKQIEKLKVTLGKYRLGGAYVPASHKSTDKYSLAESKRDSKAMIASKLSTLFK